MLGELAQDIRYGFRHLRRKAGVSALILLTLALGIGAASAIFSVVYGVLLKPLPYDHADQIVYLSEVDDRQQRMNFADPNFADVRSTSSSLQGMAEFSSMVMPVSAGSVSARAVIAQVSRDFFQILRVQPVRGRSFVAEEQKPGAQLAALVSHAYWQQNLNSASDLAAVRLTVAGHPVSVVGVMPPGFRFPSDTEIWIPNELEEPLPSRTAHNWQVIGRIRDGVSLSQAQAELTTIASRLREQYGRDIDMADISIVPLQKAMTHEFRPALRILMGAVLLLLLLACANAANLMLTQAAARTREFAIRSALGADRGRLMRQMMTEALLLSVSAGALGVLVALWGMRLLIAISPRAVPGSEQVTLNGPVLLFALGVSVLVATVLGLLIALRSSARNTLQQQMQSRSPGAPHHRLTRAIVAVEVAFTTILLVGAVLMARSFQRVLSVDPGFRTDHVLTMNLALSEVADDAEATRRVQFIDRLLARLRAIPGVTEVGATSALPLASFPASGTYVLLHANESVPTEPQAFSAMFLDETRTGDALYIPADGGFFRALGVRLISGRLFEDRDVIDGPHVCLISESFARQKWPGGNPLGHRIEFGNMDGDRRPLTIVGVVGDVHARSLERPVRPTIYVNVRQRPRKTQELSVVVRSSGTNAVLMENARQAMHDLDPTVPSRFEALPRILESSLNARRFNLVLMSAFACSALLLAIVGVYGVVAYSMRQRTAEIGIRMAIGATPGDVLCLVLRQGMAAVYAGMIPGVLGAVFLTRTMKSLLFGVGATDPITFCAVLLLMITASLTACAIPARRATRIDPIAALRCE